MKPSPSKYKIASHGKRLLALIIDLAIIILLINTLTQLQNPDHWDLILPSSDTSKLFSFYGLLFAILICKDLIKGCSPGKFIFGIITRPLNDLSQPPSPLSTLLRNLSLIIFPIEGILLLVDSHGRRIGDRWQQTAVIENSRAPRPIVRLMAANTIFFVAFFSFFLLQPWMFKKTAAYQTAIAFIEQSPKVFEEIGTIQDFEAPELNLNIQQSEGSAEIRVKAVGQKQTTLISVHLTLVNTPKRSWKAEQITFLENPN